MACGYYETPLHQRRKKGKKISGNVMALLSRSR